MQLTLVQSETSLSWFYIGDRQAGQTNKSNLFHCLFVLWTSCGGPTHTEEKIHSGWTCNLDVLPGGSTWYWYWYWLVFHKERDSLKCAARGRGFQKQICTETGFH